MKLLMPTSSCHNRPNCKNSVSSNRSSCASAQNRASLNREGWVYVLERWRTSSSALFVHANQLTLSCCSWTPGLETLHGLGAGNRGCWHCRRSLGSMEGCQWRAWLYLGSDLRSRKLVIIANKGAYASQTSTNISGSCCSLNMTLEMLCISNDFNINIHLYNKNKNDKYIYIYIYECYNSNSNI